MPVRQMTIVDGRAVFVDEVIDREHFGPGSTTIIGTPRPGWYRRGDGKMAYMPETLPASGQPLAGIHCEVSRDGPDGLYFVYVPEPQDQPGVPQGNDWMTAHDREVFLSWHK